MPFRDDREALRQRVDSLERDLAEEKDQHEEAQAARARLLVELDAARRELDRLRPYAPLTSPPNPRLWAIGITLLVTAGLTTLMLGARPSRHDAHHGADVHQRPPAPVPRIAVAPVDASTIETRAAIQAARSSLQECLDGAGSPRGRLVAHVRFGVDGGVTHLTIDALEGDLGRALPCVDDTLRAMAIPPPGRVLDVDVPLVFAGSP